MGASLAGGASENCATSLEKLQRLVTNLVDQPPRTLAGGCPLLNTAIDSDDGNPVLRGKARVALHEWRERIAAIVRHGQQNRALRVHIDPDAVATVIIAGLEGAVMMSRLEQTREPPHAVGKHPAEYPQTLEAGVE